VKKGEIMYKMIVVKRTYNSEEVSEVTCDKCGKKIILEKDNKRERYANINIKTKNTFYQQDESHTNQLCNDCARELYKWFDYKMANDEYYAMNSDYIDSEYDFDED
jgi:hypothetical protein